MFSTSFKFCFTLGCKVSTFISSSMERPPGVKPLPILPFGFLICPTRTTVIKFQHCSGLLLSWQEKVSSSCWVLSFPKHLQFLSLLLCWRIYRYHLLFFCHYSRCDLMPCLLKICSVRDEGKQNMQSNFLKNKMELQNTSEGKPHKSNWLYAGITQGH